jgi:lycopene beta-cyclase
LAPLGYDIVLVGGGLQNALIAMALLTRERPPTVALCERDDRLGGNHTWSFHGGDLPPGAERFVDPLVRHRWPGHRVHFPGLRRRIGSPYASIRSTDVDQVVRRQVAGAPGSALFLGRAARSVTAGRVELDRGEVLTAKLVVDARGPAPAAGRGAAGYQKFVGVELGLARPHRLDEPILMDATVAQLDGFRFVYLLPLAADRLLVEDTYFSDSPVLDRAALRERALAYALAHGFGPAEVIREEHGVLPMPWRSDGLPRADRSGPLVAGYQGGWFHPATGYSFPVAVKLAALFAARGLDTRTEEIAALAARVRRQAAYCRQLNRLLFRWCVPERRWELLARFYRLPEPVIRRFYALELRPADQARLLLGRPPGGLSLRARLARRDPPGVPGMAR